MGFFQLSLLGLLLTISILGNVWLLFKRHQSDQDLKTQLTLSKHTHEADIARIAELKATQQQLQAKLESLHQKNQLLATDQAEQQARQAERALYLEAACENQQQLQQKLEHAQQTIAQLENSACEQKALFKAETDKIQALQTQFNRQKDELKYEFKTLSAQIFQEKQKNLQTQNNAEISAMLQPLQAQISSFQNRVDAIHADTLSGNSTLKAEIKNIAAVGLKLKEEAHLLSTALRGDAQQRGAWGEAQLERTLEISGLVERIHYNKQTALKDVQGQTRQTDYLIHLPGEKHIIIDSKVSLLAYERANTATTELDQDVALNAHVKAVKKHIDDLSMKDYANLLGIHSPSFVLMFMPIEPAYIAALRHDHNLFAYGYEKNIVLVSHTTLMPILKTVSNIWALEKSHREAREIGEKAGDIYNAVCLLSERLQKLGNTLNTVSNQYNAAVRSVTGRQGLHSKVEHFTQISSRITKQMPTLAHQYFDTSQLEVRSIPTEICLESEA